MKVSVEVSWETYRSVKAYSEIVGSDPAQEIAALAEYGHICQSEGFDAAERYRLRREEEQVSAGSAGMTESEMRAQGYIGEPSRD